MTGGSCGALGLSGTDYLQLTVLPAAPLVQPLAPFEHGVPGS